MDGSILKQARATFGVDLHPALCSEALTGVQEILNARLLRYSEDLSGVLLAYNNECILSMQAPVHVYFPYMHVDVAADVTLFSPAPGMRMRGKVIQVGPDYLGLHVLGIFNASIARRHIRPDFRFKPAERVCISKADPSHTIFEGTDVQFTIHSVQRESEFFTMTGAMLQKDTEVQEHQHAKKKKAKRKHDAVTGRADISEEPQVKNTRNNLAATPSASAASVDMPGSTNGQETRKRKKHGHEHGNHRDSAAQSSGGAAAAAAASGKDDLALAGVHCTPDATAQQTALEPVTAPDDLVTPKKKKKKRRLLDHQLESEQASLSAADKQGLHQKPVKSHPEDLAHHQGPSDKIRQDSVSQHPSEAGQDVPGASVSIKPKKVKKSSRLDDADNVAGGNLKPSKKQHRPA
ncbi:hypothetical protein WJX74_010482 [Apatococcus lobatus]|uniref:RPA43 OB domain-containing protein n=1 Tax=Apatococcus lobatus TaxID=904363 RepID=A0AAW1Q283_9CHLO